MFETGPFPVDPAGVARCYARAASRVADFAVFLIDADGIIRTWNPAAVAMKGYLPEEIIGRHLDVLYTDEQRQAGMARRNLDLAARNGSCREETWRRRKDGTLFWAMVELIAIEEDGRLIGFCKIAQDFSDRRALQHALMREKERAEFALQAIGDGMISVDAQGRVEFINPAGEALTGWASADARGRPLDEVYRVVRGADPLPAGDEVLHELIAGLPASGPVSATLRRSDGAEIAIEENMSSLHGEDGDPRGGVVIFRDVTLARGRLQRLAHQATHDALTGLVNRAEFERRLARAIDHARDGPLPGALIYFDLDRFKTVNDTCGHEAGDELLRRLTRHYAGLVRERDTLARMGGDEFALIIEHCTVDDAHAVAAKILAATERFDFSYCGRRFTIGVSIGVTMFHHSPTTSGDIVQLADRACYMAKAGGRNRIETSRMH